MQYTHCPFCGQQYRTSEAYHFHCHACGKHIWLNSKPTASTLIVDAENRLLLGKRSVEPSKGKWDVIGGFLNYGEHPEDGAVREAKEETGLDVQVVRLLGMFMDTYGTDKEATLNMCFLVKVIKGIEKANDDIAELRWFSVDQIPPEIAFDNGRRMIEEWKATLT